VRIFIDEAGAFAYATKPWSVSCVGALVVPDAAMLELEDVVPRLAKRWGIAGEIKGRELSEEQARQLIALLSGYNVLFVSHAIDMALESCSFIDLQRRSQADEITRRLTSEFHPTYAAQVRSLSDGLRALPDNLYVQTVATIDTIYEAIQTATLYYVQRNPEELSAFEWTIDAKDKTRTRYETLWDAVVLPAIQSKSFRDPLVMLCGADYSWFAKFEETLTGTPSHLIEPLGERGPTRYTSITAILHSRTFADSRDIVGLQLVDAVTSILRRAFQGHLGDAGWSTLGSLLVRSRRQRNSIHMFSMAPHGVRVIRHRHAPYLRVVPHLDRTARPMLRR